jgi:hypothetical protein
LSLGSGLFLAFSCAGATRGVWASIEGPRTALPPPVAGPQSSSIQRCERTLEPPGGITLSMLTNPNIHVIGNGCSIVGRPKGDRTPEGNGRHVLRREPGRTFAVPEGRNGNTWKVAKGPGNEGPPLPLRTGW